MIGTSVQSSRSSYVVGRRGQLIKGRGSGRGQTVLQDMEEHELIDFLSQYEDSESLSPRQTVSHMTIT